MQLPYGGVIADGRKRCETRSWATTYRGWVAIHNGKSWPKGLRRFVRQWTDWNDDDLRAEIAAVFGRFDYDNCPGDLYEDVNGDSGLGDAVPVPGALARLYQDANDNGAVDTGDVFVAETTTDVSGAYSFSVAATALATSSDL